MIIIIRALSHVRKGWWKLWFPHKLAWDFGLKIKGGQRSQNKKEAIEPKQKKYERKREKGQCYYHFSTLVLQSSTMIFMIESLLCCHFHILVAIFHYRTWLVYSNDGLPQNALGHEQASWMHTHLVFFLSFHKLIALVHPLHGNPYSLALISIVGHLHSSLICLVDVRLSSPFLSSPQPPSYSTYSAISMAHAHVMREDWKSLRILKYETIAWLKPWLCMI